MLEELRAQVSDFPFDDEPPAKYEQEVEYDVPEHKYFLGMTPAQRFMVSFLVFTIVLLVGVFALLVTERIFLM